ncbi:MAG: dTDP-4-dehydrorhamnose reductase [Flavobacteriales bacterium]|nr:dTDP-4-dehydrorhamnose reductase [Flavobacteriales bacterium]
MVVLVTGANGQLGQALQSIASKFLDIKFVFCDSTTLDITNKENIDLIFEKYAPDFCINAAAYTAVDKAESEPEKAYLINVEGVKNLAEVCKNSHTKLLHISTDFVFDGTKNTPYAEEDFPNPTGVYGITKLKGEQVIQEILEEHFIIRTSWVYSEYGHNFMKTMLRLANEKGSLTVVNDQIGTPTHAVDLAEVLLKIISTNNQQPTTNNYGTYHFSNEGQCSWYDFAKKIFELNHVTIDLKPIPTASFPTPAKRPSYSVLDKTKIKTTFGLTINPWEESLKNIAKPKK